VGALLLGAGSYPAVGWAAVAVGLGLVVLAGAVRQRWEIAYKGHRVRFENGALTAERLYIDDELAARGGFGFRMEMRGMIRTSDGVGDQIMVLSEAGLFRFRCRIIA
jgi:hypothetical protein